jgi:hypothetical protein
MIIHKGVKEVINTNDTKQAVFSITLLDPLNLFIGLKNVDKL